MPAERRHPLVTVQQLRRALREADEERFLLQAALRRLRTVWHLALTVPLTAGATLAFSGYWSTKTTLAENGNAASLIEGVVIVAPPAIPPSFGPQMQPSATRDRIHPARVQKSRPRGAELQPIVTIVTHKVQGRDRSGFRSPPRIPSASR